MLVREACDPLLLCELAVAHIQHGNESCAAAEMTVAIHRHQRGDKYNTRLPGARRGMLLSESPHMSFLRGERSKRP